MNAKWLAIFLSAAALLFSAAARADDGLYYVGGDLGIHKLDRIDTGTPGISRQWRWSTDNGLAGLARLGYELAPDWRIEIEGGYRPAEISAIRANLIAFPLLVPATGLALSNVGGHIDQTTLMANVLFDIPLGWRVQPYIGAGAGLVHTDVSAHGALPFCPICATPVVICFPACTINVKAGGSDDRVGLQLLGGVSIALDDRFTLDATYRFLHTEGATWNSTGTIYTAGNFKGNLSDSTATLGIRYAFSTFGLGN